MLTISPGLYSVLFFCFVLRLDLMKVKLAPTHYVAEDGLKLLILLPPSPECWDYRCFPTCPALCSAGD